MQTSERARNADPPRYPNAPTLSRDARNSAPLQPMSPRRHRAHRPLAASAKSRSGAMSVVRLSRRLAASSEKASFTSHFTASWRRRHSRSCGAVAVPVGPNDLGRVDGGSEAFPQNFRPRLEIVGSLPERLAEDLAMFGLRGSAMRRRPLLERPDEFGADVSNSQLAHCCLHIIAFFACDMRAAGWLGKGRHGSMRFTRGARRTMLAGTMNPGAPTA